jgi:hypothetical protein
MTKRMHPEQFSPATLKATLDVLRPKSNAKTKGNGEPKLRPTPLVRPGVEYDFHGSKIKSKG